MEDEQVHTASCPYCGDGDCWCHTNVEYHEQVTSMGSDVDEEELQQAYSFFGVEAA